MALSWPRYLSYRPSLSRQRCKCQLHREGRARTALHWCVRTTPQTMGRVRPSGNSLAFQVLPQTKEPAWISLQDLCPPDREPWEATAPPRPILSFPSLQGSQPQTSCEQSKAVPAAPRHWCASVSVRKAAQNPLVLSILSVWLFNVTASHRETQ